MTETTAEMMSEWLNQVLQGICNDPVIVEFWSAMKMGNQSGGKAGIDPYRVLGLEKTLPMTRSRNGTGSWWLNCIPIPPG